MSSKIYCGISEVPKGKKRGSMQECAEKNQIRYYGEKKVDKKIIDSMMETKIFGKSGNIEKQFDNLKIKLAGMISKMKNLTRKIDDEEDKKGIKKLEKEKTDLEKEIDKSRDKLIALKKKIETQKKQKRISSAKKQKKSTKRKSTKKKSAKRKSSKSLKRSTLKKNKKQFGGGNNKSKNSGKEEDYSWVCE